jgi:hypothetical protein
MKHNSLKKTVLSVCFFIVFLAVYLLGFASGVKKGFPYTWAKSIHMYIKVASLRDTGDLLKCSIPELTTLPDNFSVIIGHAYGTHKNAKYDDFIADSVFEFLVKNKNYIEKIVFTGDVFSIPSKQKWERLFDEFGSRDVVLVAPGNHDLKRPDSRDVFKASNFIRQDYPYEVNINGFNLVVDDSVSSKWIVDSKLKRQILNSENEDILVARHHILIPELSKFANSSNSPVPLPSVETFIKNFPSHKSLTWIMGDGGAFDRLPRITCHAYRNHRFIVNGIGEVKNDTLLILHDGNIFSHIIR